MSLELKALPDCCEEASMFSLVIYIPCNAPATKLVKHKDRNERVYRMCAECADHNVHNRNAEIVGPYRKESRPPLTDGAGAPNPGRQDSPRKREKHNG